MRAVGNKGKQKANKIHIKFNKFNFEKDFMYFLLSKRNVIFELV